MCVIFKLWPHGLAWGGGEVTSLGEICACVVSEDPSADTPCLSRCDPLALYNSLHCRSCIQLGKIYTLVIYYTDDLYHKKRKKKKLKNQPKNPQNQKPNQKNTKEINKKYPLMGSYPYKMIATQGGVKNGCLFVGLVCVMPFGI